MKKVQILTTEAIQQKTRRIAYQIVEDNYDEDELVLIGIKPNGLEYAAQLKKEIEAIDGMKVVLLELSLNKAKPLEEEISLELGKKTLNNKTVIVVDDVANTGKTLYYALKPVMDFLPKKVQAVVLVDRQHKLFPVSPDFVGLSLSTTMKEHIQVEFDTKGKGVAYLT
ncbi:MAG TPA: phosphoribosyltransferase family protein [Chitinophagales bacterium]|nr:phosphoribosyltransferase family protein [Chitinophagales bacterium]